MGTSKKSRKRSRGFARFILVIAVVGVLLWYAGLMYVKPAVADMSRLIHSHTPNYVTYDQISPLFFDALIATEDRRYYIEGGIDWIGIARSVWVDLRAGALVEGGSTITQQLVRDVLLTDQKTFLRKLKEILIATETARMYSKQKVLELYANEVYFGNHAYGIAAASRIYFGETPSQLTLPQAALLAGIVQAPSLLDPVTHPENAKARRRVVLENLVETGQISSSEANAAKEAPLLPNYRAK